MNTVFTVLQAVTSALLITCILLQSRGTGVGAAFGGEGNVYRTKRGAEKMLFIATIVITILFLGSVFAPLAIPS